MEIVQKDERLSELEADLEKYEGERDYYKRKYDKLTE